MLFMENSPQTALSEIMALAASIREQLALLESRLAELQRDAENVTAEVPVDIFQEAADLPDSVGMMPEEPEDLPEDAFADDGAVYGEENGTPAADALKDESKEKNSDNESESGQLDEVPARESEDDIVLEPESGRIEEVSARESVSGQQEKIPVRESEPEQQGGIFVPDTEEEVSAVESEEGVLDMTVEDDMLLPFAGEDGNASGTGASVPLSVMDVMSEKEAWRKDMPGQPVRDVRSAISLNDRASFIRVLFREDPLLFSNSIMEINGMETLAEVEAYLKKFFPEWNMESDAVYRFMMAVRRKVR